MLELLGRGYCGGHVTLIFTIEDSDPDPVNQGSRGVGICLEDGVEIICRGREGRAILMSSSLTILAILDCIWTA